ncbi:solute carrier family 30 (zinc transporter), member 5/7, partial [Tremellales sp. Uapishka_1]
MQAPPTPLHRNILPVPLRKTPLQSHRRSTSASTSVPKLLVGAVAVTACTTWVIEAEGTGGEGWLILGYWFGKVVLEASEFWTGRRRKKGSEEPQDTAGLADRDPGHVLEMPGSPEGIIPIPVPSFTLDNSYLILYLLAGLLIRHLPLNTRDPKERLVVLLAVPILQFFAFHPASSVVDILIYAPLSCISIALHSPSPAVADPRAREWSFPTSQKPLTQRSPTGFVPSKWRPHLQTILNTPASSKIFYFLLLNLAYMGVQMVYGMWTNSLGLISDAIHMFFDCLGLAVGLWASVAATWKPDGRYTFGYARVETLSGFGNGCFLILISIFIIFEGIQRVFDPPEMDTHQLLLVSGVGLAINLWGMYATGGHHHQGHGHSHDHSHSVPVNEKKVDHRTPDHDHHHASSQDFSATSGRQLHERKSSLSHVHSHEGHSHSDCAHDHDDSHIRDADDHNHGHGQIPTANGHGHPAHHHHRDSDHNSSQPHEEQDHHAHRHHDSPHAHHHNDSLHAHYHNDTHHHHDSHDNHDHAHSHNMRGVFLHVLADTLGSVGVIISTLLIKFTGWTGFDPIASLFIAALIIASVVPLVIESGRILCLDVGQDKEAEIRSALAELSTIEGVSNYGSPRFWPRCEGQYVGSLHIQLAPSPASSQHSSSYGNRETIYYNADRVSLRVDKVLKHKIRGLVELVIQIEGSEDRSYCSCMTKTGR